MHSFFNGHAPGAEVEERLTGHAQVLKNGGILAAVLLLGSCRSVTAPESSFESPGVAARPAAHLLDDAARAGRCLPGNTTAADSQMLPVGERQVPVVYRLQSFADQRGLHFWLFLRPDVRGDRPFYAPRTAGGWQFQTFLNIDRDASTGYWDGYEFLTRDSEVGLEPGTLVVRRTEGGGGPGGWGEEIVRIPVRITPHFATFTVPLAAIGDDGVVNFAIELYATVLGGDDGQTPVASFFRYYTGSSTLRMSRWSDPGHSRRGTLTAVGHAYTSLKCDDVMRAH